MIEIHTQVTINANAHKVWETLTNFSSFSAWNPFIVNVQGLPGLENKIAITIKPEGEKPMTFKPRIVAFNPNQELKWLGSLFIKGIFDGEHCFQLKSLNENQTLLIHKENFSGILHKLVMKKILKSTTDGFNAMNLALKERCEKNI